MTDFIIIAVLALIIGCASFYIYRSKKRGNKCIGCPYAAMCKKGCKYKDSNSTN